MKRRLWLLKFQRCLLSSLLVTTLYNDVDGIPTCLTPRQIVDSTQNSCVIVFASNSCEVEKHSQSDTVIDVLSRSAFKDEPGVKIGKITLANFRWPNFQSIKLSTGEAIVGDVLLFPKHKPDRTCLLTDKSQSQSPTPVLYSGVKNVDNIVEFINFHCNKYRTSTGSLNVAGLHRQNILESIFSVSSVSDVKSKDVFGKSLSKSCLIASKAQSDECNFTKSQKYQSNLAKDNQKEMKKCDRIPVPRKEEFFHQYLKISKPVVIQNAIGHWDVFTKWSNEYLHQLYGENSVHVKLTPGGEFEGVERASLWEDYETFKIPSKVKEQLQYPDLVVVRPATANVKFSEFLELVEKVSKGVVRNVSAYLEYSSIPEHLPDLEKDIQELAFMEGLLKRAHLNIWLSDGNTLGKLHFDPFDNLLCQVHWTRSVFHVLFFITIIVIIIFSHFLNFLLSNLHFSQFLNFSLPTLSFLFL